MEKIKRKCVQCGIDYESGVSKKPRLYCSNKCRINASRTPEKKEQYKNAQLSVKRGQNLVRKISALQKSIDYLTKVVAELVHGKHPKD